MTNYNKVIESAKDLLLEAEKYAVRPTKASSARMRKMIQSIKNAGTEAKKDLMAADKGGN
jgi:hypothetical protein